MSTPRDGLFNNTTPTLGASYTIIQPAYQGPLDLLLHLIERQELDISEISLMQVTDGYMETMAQLEEIQPGALADFLVVASRLIYIKSRALLPKPPAVDEETEEDEADALVRQLLEYRQFKEVAAALGQRMEEGLRVYVRLVPRPTLERQLDLSNVDLSKLHRALRRALARMPTDPPMRTVSAYTVTVAEQIGAIRSYIRRVQAMIAEQGAEAGPVTFASLLERSTSRMEVIVTFLAVLELIKQRELIAVQEETFGEIQLRLGEEADG